MGNPEALVIVALGMFLIILGFKNTAPNLIAAATGKPYQGSTLR